MCQCRNQFCAFGPSVGTGRTHSGVFPLLRFLEVCSFLSLHLLALLFVALVSGRIYHVLCAHVPVFICTQTLPNKNTQFTALTRHFLFSRHTFHETLALNGDTSYVSDRSFSVQRQRRFLTSQFFTGRWHQKNRDQSQNQALPLNRKGRAPVK